MVWSLGAQGSSLPREFGKEGGREGGRKGPPEGGGTLVSKLLYPDHPTDQSGPSRIQRLFFVLCYMAEHVPNWDALGLSYGSGHGRSVGHGSTAFKASFDGGVPQTMASSASVVDGPASPGSASAGFRGSPKKTLSSQGLYNVPEPPPETFYGYLQPVAMRPRKKPAVDFEKGGTDFRCPVQMSSMGPQVRCVHARFLLLLKCL